MLDAQAERDPDDEGDFMAFEQLMAEATAKRENKKEEKEKPEKEKKKDRHRSHLFGGHGHERASSASPPGKTEKV